MSNPVTMLCSYFPKSGHEEQLRALVEKHWPVLDRLGLVSKEPAKVFVASDKRANKSWFVEIFSWKDEGSSDVAHQTPEVMRVWEPMGEHAENMTFVRIDPIGGG